jgi:hypothetical protein
MVENLCYIQDPQDQAQAVINISVAEPEPEPESEPLEPYHFAAIRTGTVIFLLVPVPSPVPDKKDFKCDLDILGLKGIRVGEQIKEF